MRGVFGAIVMAGTFIIVLGCVVSVNAYIADELSHPPPDNGTYMYSPPGTFYPGDASFPSAGESYTDPAFNETVTRVTGAFPTQDRHTDYSCKLVINADNTMGVFEWGTMGSTHIYTLADGAEFRPDAFDRCMGDWSWHPTDPDIMLIYNRGVMTEYSVSADQTTTIKSFGSANVGANGCTGEFTDQTGRYLCGMINGRIRFYDRVEDVFYANEPSVGGIDYILMGPDGSGVLSSTSPSRWHPVDHDQNTFLSPTQILSRSNHGDLITDSDGQTWYIHEGDVTGRVYQTNVNTGVSTTLINIGSAQRDWHFSGNINGPNRDWFCISVFGANDISSSAPWSNWVKFKDEVFLVNVKTGNVRRLCHHRCRNVQANYWFQIKASLSIDGSRVVFNSNMGRVSGHYVDSYMVSTGFATATAATPVFRQQVTGIDLAARSVGHNEMLINYQLPKTGLYTLSMRNVRGQKVWEYSNQAHTVGTQPPLWRTGNPVAAGAYFIMLKQGQHRKAYKAVIAK